MLAPLTILPPIAIKSLQASLIVRHQGAPSLFWATALLEVPEPYTAHHRFFAMEWRCAAILRQVDEQMAGNEVMSPDECTAAAPRRRHFVTCATGRPAQIVFAADERPVRGGERLQGELVIQVRGSARPARRHGQREPGLGQGRAARAPAGGAQPVRAAAFPARRAGQRGSAAALPLHRPAPRRNDPAPALAPPGHQLHAAVHG